MKIKIEYDVAVEELVSEIADTIQLSCEFGDTWCNYVPESYWDDCNENVQKEVQRVVDALVIEELVRRMEKGEAIFE
jgi:hypothetical protein